MSFESLINQFIGGILFRSRGGNMKQHEMNRFTQCRSTIKQGLKSVEWAMYGLDIYVINVIMKTGDQFLAEGEAEIALNFFREACYFWPSSAVCFIREAQCHLMLKSFDPSKKSLRKAIPLIGVDKFDELCKTIDEFIKNDKLKEAHALYSTLAEKFPRHDRFSTKVKELNTLLKERTKEEKNITVGKNVTAGEKEKVVEDVGQTSNELGDASEPPEEITRSTKTTISPKQEPQKVVKKSKKQLLKEQMAREKVIRREIEKAGKEQEEKLRKQEIEKARRKKEREEKAEDLKKSVKEEAQRRKEEKEHKRKLDRAKNNEGKNQQTTNEQDTEKSSGTSDGDEDIEKVRKEQEMEARRENEREEKAENLKKLEKEKDQERKESTRSRYFAFANAALQDKVTLNDMSSAFDHILASGSHLRRVCPTCDIPRAYSYGVRCHLCNSELVVWYRKINTTVWVQPRMPPSEVFGPYRQCKHYIQGRKCVKTPCRFAHGQDEEEIWELCRSKRFQPRTQSETRTKGRWTGSNIGRRSRTDSFSSFSPWQSASVIDDSNSDDMELYDDDDYYYGRLDDVKSEYSSFSKDSGIRTDYFSSVSPWQSASVIDDSSNDDMDISDDDDDYYGRLDDLKSEYSSFSKDSGIPSSECSSFFSKDSDHSFASSPSIYSEWDAYLTNEDLSLFRGESYEERYRRVNEYPAIRTEEWGSGIRQLIEWIFGIGKSTSDETKLSSTSVKASGQVPKIISSVMKKEGQRCRFCGIMFPSLLDLEYHYSEPQHKVNVIRLTQKFHEKTNTSNFRPPPDGVYMGRYKECRRFEQGYCYFGEKCTFAHGKAECDHWKSLYKHQADHLTHLKERQLLTESFAEKVRLRIKYEGLDRVLTKELFGVTVDCSSPMQIKLEKIDRTHVKHTWIFDVKIQRMLQSLPRQVAFLMETHLDKFKLLFRGGKQRQSPNLYSVHFVEGDFEYVARNESAVQFRVQFSSRVFGDFKQKLVFDFGKDNVLVCPLFVSVVGKYISEEETSSSTRYCHIDEWCAEKMELVPCKELTGMDLDGLCERYSIPKNNQQTDLTECSKFSRETYFDIWHNILFIEEQHIQKEIARYDIQDGKMKVVSTFKSAESTVFAAPGEFFGEIYLSDYLVMDEVAGHIINRSVMSVVLRLKMEKSHKNRVYECSIKLKTSQFVVIKLNEILCQEHTFENDEVVQIDLKFRYNRLPLCEMHEAIDMCKQKIDILFPNVKNMSSQNSIQDWHLEKNPNANQHKAIAMILDPNPTPPILLIGPFGTGKTFTLNLACVSILSQSEGDKVLICTHSNSAADIHLEHLDLKIRENPSLCIRPLRVLNLFRNVRAVPEKLRRYCNIEEETNVIQKPTWNVIRDHNVIITTLATARVLWEYYQGGKLRFTHILVDEAAQALEPESLTPLVMADENTKIVLAGDHKQMGPPVYSKSTWPEEFDPMISLLERLFSYYNSSSSLKEGSEDISYVKTPCVVLLSENYRCHKKILKFPSDNFYGGKLVASGEQTTHKIVPVLSFYTAQGVDKQAEEGLSYYNDAEVSEVVAKVEELIHLWPEDWKKNIGVLTPYRDQVKRIREGLRKNGLAFVDVETVENAQGKEFKALFISTVRTMWTCSVIEGRSSDPSELDFGFLSDPRFLNTAVTRAQSLLAVVGDPMSLCSVGACRDLWKDYLRRCEDNKGLHGCTLKTVMDFCIRSEPLDPSAQEFTYLKDDKKAKEDVIENDEKDFPEETIIDSEHNFTKDDKKAKKTVKKSGKQTFLEKTILDSEYNIKEEVHEIFKGFSWLRGAYGITGPNKTIPRTHIYLTVKRGKKKSEVLKEIKKHFKCDPRKYFELFREPEKKPTFKYLSNPTSGGSILAVNSSSEPNPLRVANDIEGSDTSTASGTLTMLCSQNDKHYALTCFHVGCATDESLFEEAFNRRQRFLGIQRCMKSYENFARGQEYHYRERGTDNADQNENIVAGLPANYTPLGQFYKCCFHSESDIMSIQVHEDVQVDCGVEDIGNPDWNRISKELHRRVNRKRRDRVMVQKVGFLPNDNHKGYIVNCDYTYNYDGEILFKNAILIKGMAGTFLRNGDSGALLYFLDSKKVKQAFAYGVCEVDDPYSQEAMSSDEELSEDSSESGSSDQTSSSSDDEEVALIVTAEGNEEFSATPKVRETKDGIVDDSDEEFVFFRVEGPLFIGLNLKTGLRNLELLDKGCFSECGNNR